MKKNIEAGKQTYGRVINIASIYGLVGNTAIPTIAYHATKGAVVNFTRGAAAELAKCGIPAAFAPRRRKAAQKGGSRGKTGGGERQRASLRACVPAVSMIQFHTP